LKEFYGNIWNIYILGVLWQPFHKWIFPLAVITLGYFTEGIVRPLLTWDIFLCTVLQYSLEIIIKGPFFSIIILEYVADGTIWNILFVLPFNSHFYVDFYRKIFFLSLSWDTFRIFFPSCCQKLIVLVAPIIDFLSEEFQDWTRYRCRS